MTDEQSLEQEKQQKQDDELIDLGKVKDSLKRFFKKKENVHHPEHPHEEPSRETHREESSDESIDFQKIRAGLKKHAKWLVPLLCILLAMSVSIYFRTMPLRLPIADSWAENTVADFYKNQLQQQIDQQYPNLPEQNRQVLVEKEWEKFSLENKELLDGQNGELGRQFRNQYRDDAGTPYLLGIDPYYYYRQTQYVLENGYPGTSIKDGKPWDDYRLAPIGREAEWNFHHWFGAWWHRFLNLFGDYPLMFTFFLVGTVFAALTVVPGFFIGKILTRNNVGGFFTALLLAVSSFFVARTTGESSDTDVYSVFFPVLITWLFLESLEAKTMRKKLVWISLAGFSTGVFAFAWTGWWYIATFIVVTLTFRFFFEFILYLSRRQAGQYRESAFLGAAYLLASGIFVSLLTRVGEVTRIALGSLGFIRLKAVAVFSYWPNIRTTVAELNVVPLQRVVEQLDGRFLFVLAILGILLVLLRRNGQQVRNYHLAFFLALWLGASLYATTKGIRFILQVTPVYSIALGTFLGLTWLYASRWIHQEIKIPSLVTKIVVFAVLAFLLLQPVKSGYSQAFNSVPSVNDAWYNALTKIKEETPENSIITSWWDFGHWFKAIAERPVTFDGGTQVGWGAYWVGHSLLTPDEKTTVGIVRMLNCGQNSAFVELDKFLNDTPRSIELLHQVIVRDKNSALQALQAEGLSKAQAEGVMQYTHCDVPPSLYITSEDMVGKSGVWGHFGSWDFKKAVIHNKVRGMPREEAVQYLITEFTYTPAGAEQIYSEVQSTDADKWIAPWPGYLSGFSACEKGAENLVRCLGSVQGGNFALLIDVETYNVSFEGGSNLVPNSIVYTTPEGIQEKNLEGNKIGFSVVLRRDGEDYSYLIADPRQAASMFTKLFFLEGHGLECFRRFDDRRQSGSQGRIITWEVDYQCRQRQENQAFFRPEEEVNAAHILIATGERSGEDALALAKEIKSNLTEENFAQYARDYSEDPGSRENGGDLGWFKRGVMVPEFEETAFALTPGQISEPIQTQFGYHLILVKEKRTR